MDDNSNPPHEKFFDDRLPIIFTIDPFKFTIDQAIERVEFLNKHEAYNICIGSTDDEGYDEIVPNFINSLSKFSRLKVIEHFRPKKYVGFRRVSSENFVLMTNMAHSDDDFYNKCMRVEGIGDTGDLSYNERSKKKLVRCSAFVFGNDEKTKNYVSSTGLDFSPNRDLSEKISSKCSSYDVIYLYSRFERLPVDLCRFARESVREGFPLIMSGCIRSKQDVKDILGAGASAIVIGSLLEDTHWEKLIARCIEAVAP